MRNFFLFFTLLFAIIIIYAKDLPKKNTPVRERPRAVNKTLPPAQKPPPAVAALAKSMQNRSAPPRSSGQRKYEGAKSVVLLQEIAKAQTSFYKRNGRYAGSFAELGLRPGKDLAAAHGLPPGMAVSASGHNCVDGINCVAGPARGSTVILSEGGGESFTIDLDAAGVALLQLKAGGGHPPALLCYGRFKNTKDFCSSMGGKKSKERLQGIGPCPSDAYLIPI